MMRKIVLLGLVFMVLKAPVFAHDEHAHTHHVELVKSESNIKLSIVKIEDRNGKKLVQIKLTKIKDGTPVTLKDLKEVHTQKIHLLIIDASLADYSHIHPKPTKEAGVYEFEWNPSKKNATYRVWADLFPLDTNTQEYAITDLQISKNSHAPIDRTVSMQSMVGGMTFKLTFDHSDLRVGKAAMGKIMITDDKGNPVRDLEPIMEAFAHIVGFSEDFKTVVHIHPLAREPTKDTDRGGPELLFHIELEKAGFIKLFAQISIKGKELFAPFGIMVKG